MSNDRIAKAEDSRQDAEQHRQQAEGGREKG